MNLSLFDSLNNRTANFNWSCKTAAPDFPMALIPSPMPILVSRFWTPLSPMICSERSLTAAERPTLRMAAAEHASPSSSPNVQPSSDAGHSTLLAGKKVAVCEDEGVTQVQLMRILKRAGLTIVGAANNGKKGVEIVLRERPDLVLMDIRMPIMDGVEATRRIMSEYSPCVVMLTAFADTEVREEARIAGSSGFLLKPVTAQSLIAALEQYYLSFQADKEG